MGIDWTRTRRASYEWWLVDRATWGDASRLDMALPGRLAWDASTATREGASLEVAGGWGAAEAVLRCYMSAEQGGERERVCLGTYVARRTRALLDGSRRCSLALHSAALMPLEGAAGARALAPVGWTVPAGANCAEAAASVCRERGIAPVVASRSAAALARPWSAGASDTWLAAASALAAAAGMEVRGDPSGRVVIAPPPAATPPAWTFADGDASVRLPGLASALDYGAVPNVCEVTWREGGRALTARAVNDDPGSPVSTASRGYEAVLRVEGPGELQSGASAEAAALVARKRLMEASSVSGELTFSHSWVPLRAGEGVRVVSGGAALDGVVRSMEMELGPAGLCETTATVSGRLWGGE